MILKDEKKKVMTVSMVKKKRNFPIGGRICIPHHVKMLQNAVIADAKPGNSRMRIPGKNYNIPTTKHLLYIY